MVVHEIVVDEAFRKEMNKYRVPDKTVGLIASCSKNVVVFAEYMLGLKLYSWQIYFLNEIIKSIEAGNKIIDIDKEFVALTSRQIGKSTAIAVLGLWCTVFNKYSGTKDNNTLYGITSASDIQAKKLLYEMKKFIRIGDRFMERTYQDEDKQPMFGKDFFDNLLDLDEPNNTTTITFKAYKQGIHGDYLLKDSLSGSIIKSYAPTSSILGETFTVVVIDEAGKSDRISDQFFYDYIAPTGDSTNAIYVYTSTAWVCSGFYYRLVDPDDMFSDSPAKVMAFTIEAIKDENPVQYGKVMKRVKKLQDDGKMDEVQRAYYCRFVKGDISYFDPKKVFGGFTTDYSMYANGSEKICDIGVDFGGKVKSRTVITVSSNDFEDMKVRRLYKKKYEVGMDDNLIEDIKEVMKLFPNWQRIIPDDCPAGMYIIREMIDLGWNVHPMNFRAEKVKKYGAFRATLNRGDMLSFDDDECKTEMLAMEFSNRTQGSIIQAAAGYTDDEIDSWVLSCYFYIYEEEGVCTYDYYEEDDL